MTKLKISAKKAQNFVEKFKGEKRTDLELMWIKIAATYEFYRVFELSDGRVIHFDEVAGGFIYESETVMIENFQELLKLEFSSVPELHEDFKDKIIQNIADLAVKLNLPKNILDFSFKSLGDIQRYIRKWNGGKSGAGEAVITGLFPQLLAYIGEVVRKQIGGDWQMHFDVQNKSWEASIELPDGKVLKIQDELLKALDDDQEGGFCLAAINDELNPSKSN